MKAMHVKWIALCSFAALLLVTTRCTCESEESRAAKARQKLNQFEGIMNVKFPSSARLLNYRVERWMDEYIGLKIEIARDDLESFLNNSPFAGKRLKSKKDNPIFSVRSTGPRWWKVKSVNEWLSGNVMLPQTEGLRILLDMDHAHTVIIYLEWLDT